MADPNPWLPREGQLLGQVAIVSGATSGIGLETAAGLAKAGAKVIFAVRNAKKAESVAAAIRERVPRADLVYPPAVPAVDMMQPASIREFASAVLQHEKAIHILINNAGMSRLPNESTEQGVASLVQSNYLGPWLLTHTLTPGLVAGKARVVSVSSLTGRTCVLAEPRVFLTSWHHSWYKHTKLANVLHAFELQRRLGPLGVTSCAMDPGGVNTAIWSSTLFSSFPIKQIINQLYAPASDAAEVVLHAACVPWALEALPGVSPAEDLRFYARGLDTSPLVTHWDGALKTWSRLPVWGLYGASALMHSLADYPLRNWSGGRLCSKVLAVPFNPQAYDPHLATQLWNLSDQLCLPSLPSGASTSSAPSPPLPSLARPPPAAVHTHPSLPRAPQQPAATTSSAEQPAAPSAAWQAVPPSAMEEVDEAAAAAAAAAAPPPPAPAPAPKATRSGYPGGDIPPGAPQAPPSPPLAPAPAKPVPAPSPPATLPPAKPAATAAHVPLPGKGPGGAAAAGGEGSPAASPLKLQSEGSVVMTVSGPQRRSELDQVAQRVAQLTGKYDPTLSRSFTGTAAVSASVHMRPPPSSSSSSSSSQAQQQAGSHQAQDARTPPPAPQPPPATSSPDAYLGPSSHPPAAAAAAAAAAAGGEGEAGAADGPHTPPGTPPSTHPPPGPAATGSASPSPASPAVTRMLSLASAPKNHVLGAGLLSGPRGAGGGGGGGGDPVAEQLSQYIANMGPPSLPGPPDLLGLLKPAVRATGAGAMAGLGGPLPANPPTPPTPPAPTPVAAAAPATTHPSAPAATKASAPPPATGPSHPAPAPTPGVPSCHKVTWHSPSPVPCPADPQPAALPPLHPPTSSAPAPVVGSKRAAEQPAAPAPAAHRAASPELSGPMAAHGAKSGSAAASAATGKLAELAAETEAANVKAAAMDRLGANAPASPEDAGLMGPGAGTGPGKGAAAGTKPGGNKKKGKSRRGSGTNA